MLCRTYPFYLDNGELMCSECQGLGGKIEPYEAYKIAERLILRYLFETRRPSPSWKDTGISSGARPGKAEDASCTIARASTELKGWGLRCRPSAISCLQGKRDGQLAPGQAR